MNRKCVKCRAKAKPGYCRCADCLAYSKVYQAVWKAKQISNGKCYSCGIRKPKTDRLECESCLSDKRFRRFGRRGRIYKRYKPRKTI